MDRRLLAMAAATVAGLLAASIAVAGVSFSGPTLYSIPDPYGEPHVQLADMNLDGRLDLVQVSGSTGGSVQLGNGDGTFGPVMTFDDNGIFGWGLAVGDFNGDGKPDIATTHSGSASPPGIGQHVAILLGDGAGGFSSLTTIPIADNMYAIVAGHFNGDANLDLAVTTGGGSLLLLLGDGHGGFSAPVTVYSGLVGPVAMVAADLDLDGKPDLAIANQSGDNVTVLLGDGHGGFVLASTPAAQDGPSAIAVADLNGDGKPDLVVGNQNSGTVTVLLGNGSGTAWSAASYAAGGGGTGIAVADLDGDGKLDVVTANQATNTVWILTGNGAGGLTVAASASVPSPNAIAAGDLNGDGKPDLAVSSRFGSLIAVLLNTSTPPVPVATVAPTAAFTYAPIPAQPGQAVVFDGSTSYDNDSVGCDPATDARRCIRSYAWAFGDGATLTTAVATASHTYAAAGAYTATLTVTDNDGETATFQAVVQVASPPPPPVTTAPPTAAFTYTPIPALPGQPVTFDASTSYDNDAVGCDPTTDGRRCVVSWAWTFGDGATLTTSVSGASHTYAVVGSYTVTLTVTDNDGETATFQHVVQVTTPPPPTPAAATQQLIGSVNALVTSAVLSPSEARALTTKLDAALQSIASGQPSAARGQLGAFINQVNALLRSHRLSAAQAQALIDAANAVIAAL